MSLLHCVLGDFRLSVQMHGKPFPTWGSHNMLLVSFSSWYSCYEPLGGPWKAESNMSLTALKYNIFIYLLFYLSNQLLLFILLLFCKNLDCGALELLLVWVDKENSIEFSFNCCTLLIHILYLLLFIKSHTSPLSHSFSHVHWLFN